MGKAFGRQVVAYRPRVARESDRYRGKRRRPQPARGRLNAALATACLCAAATAFTAGASLSDQKPGESAVDVSALAAASDRAEAAGAANRSDREAFTDVTTGAMWRLPVRGYKVTSEYGQRSGRLAAGIDLAEIKEGTPVSAVADGVVIAAGRDGNYGNVVRIDHGNGEISVYGHNSDVLVAEGQQVSAGDVIAQAGNTGYSFNTHLHLEIWVNGRPADPIAFFGERGVDFFMETEAVFGSE
jgi:murein DD-endopeptidase MepM/ murein hydrolase activator NlpD